MSEKNETPQPEKKQTKHLENYLFPNGGDVPAFSVKAESREEAEKQNQAFIKNHKETN